MGEEGAKEFIKILKIGDPTARELAAESLGLMGDKASCVVPEMIAHLKREENKLARSHLIWGLGNIGDGRAVPALKHEGPSGATALARLAKKGITEKTRAEALDALLEMATSQDENLRATGVSRLGDEKLSKDERVAAAVRSAPDDSSVLVRKSAAYAIPKAFGKDGIDLLKKLVKDEDKEVRMQAAIRLTELGDKTALPIIENVMFDKDLPYSIRGDCMYALEHLDGEVVIGLLKRWTKESSRDTYHANQLLKEKGVEVDSVEKTKTSK